MTNRYIDLDVGLADLEKIRTAYCEPRKADWLSRWKLPLPSLIIFYEDDDEECQFLFESETKRDAAYRRLLAALNSYENGLEQGGKQSNLNEGGLARD